MWNKVRGQFFAYHRVCATALMRLGPSGNPLHGFANRETLSEGPKDIRFEGPVILRWQCRPPGSRDGLTALDSRLLIN